MSWQDLFRGLSRLHLLTVSGECLWSFLMWDQKAELTQPHDARGTEDHQQDQHQGRDHKTPFLRDPYLLEYRAQPLHHNSKHCGSKNGSTQTANTAQIDHDKHISGLEDG